MRNFKSILIGFCFIDYLSSSLYMNSVSNASTSYVDSSLNLKSKFFFGKDDYGEAKLHFFYGPTFEDNQSYTILQGRKAILHPRFDKSKKTVLYMHGFSEYIYSEHIIEIVKSYYKRSDHNILVLDWSELSAGNYVTDAVPNALQLSYLLADMLIQYFMEDIVELSKFHLVGFSLGAQLAGMIARSFYSKTRLKLHRISALDPAFPLFYPPVYIHISANDAKFVDIIHTDAWINGAPINTGSVDFWPNNGKSLQPGCPPRTYYKFVESDLCSHKRAWMYWAESVENMTDQFIAIQCFSWGKFIYQFCNNNVPTTIMGIDCPSNVTGDYYLQTNFKYPFSRGNNGIKVI